MKHFYIFIIGLLDILSCKKHIKVDSKGENLFYKQAFVYRDKGITDSAFLYFNQAKDLYVQQKDSVYVGKSLVNMGMISFDLGDYFSAQEIGLNALSFFDYKKEAQHTSISTNYNNLGIVTHRLGDFQKALNFYDLAISFSHNSLDTLICLNNKALTYLKINDYESALKIYNGILLKGSNNKIEYARVLTNISYTKWLQDSNYNAAPAFLKALKIRLDEKDLKGQSASYNHLSEYYALRMPDSALIYAQYMLQIAKKIKSTDDQLLALQKIIQIGPSNTAQHFFSIYKVLDDSLQTVRRAARNQFALIRYETEKHKADYLRSRAENIQKEKNIQRQYFLLGFLLLVLISGYLWYRKRKQILQQEKELEVKNTELRYVKKIHDRVANKVYHVMSEVENSPALNKDALLDKLENLYNVSRDISYEQDFDTENRYAEQLSQMLQSYSSSDREVLIVGNEEALWKEVRSISKTELFYVLQELMTNMKKHSQADSVLVKFHRDDLCVNIFYSDNGVGMATGLKKNGLTNTETRIHNIHGTITFDNIRRQGLEVNISFPIH